VSETLIERLASVPCVGTDARPFSVSPDGATVAVQLYRDGDWQVFLMDPDGGDPRRVGDLDDACVCPLFSSDGRLYFARDDRGSECYDFYRYDPTSGLVANLLPETPEFSPLPDFDLSPDGSLLAMTASHGEGYSVAVMPAEASPHGAALRHLADFPYTESSPRWSPDGRRLAVAAGTRGQDTAVHVFATDGAEHLIVGGDDGFLAAHPSWAPDGVRLAFSGGPFDHPAVGVFHLETREVTWAWEGGVDAHHVVWSPDGDALAFLVDRDGETQLVLLDLETDELRDVSVGPGNHYEPRFSADGASLLVVLSGPRRPPELYRVPLDGDAVRLTDALPAGLREDAFTSGRPVRFTSLDHLAEVPGLLVEPEAPNGAGVVLVHGGPTWHHSNEWDPLRQAFVAAGFTVVHPNYRGSDGYGRRWQLANRFLMGQGEALDVAAAHRFLVEHGCDPARIAVTGRSWGGFLTMAMLTQFPELWACGVAGVPFFDFIDSQLDEDIRFDLRWWDRENTGDIVKDRAKLAYYSPINHLERIQAPLLLLGGRLDPRCPPKQIGEVAARLRARGLECEEVIYENEGHEISGLAHRVDYDTRTVEFIVRHTGGAAG
jgi:dipeptidyl aminopeptidase/acylaminoacyl peptidase